MAEPTKGAAKEEAQDAAEPAGAEAKQKASPLAGVMGILGNKVTFIASLVVVEVLVAYFVVTALIEPRLAGEPVVKEEKSAKKGAPLHLAIEDMVVNLHGSDGARFLAAGVAFELDPGKEKVSEESLEEKTPILKDAVISVLSAKSVAEVSTSEGREMIRKEIREHVAHALSPLHIEAIYFTEFVVQ